jgi:hypothetical protein
MGPRLSAVSLADEGVQALVDSVRGALEAEVGRPLDKIEARIYRTTNILRNSFKVSVDIGDENVCLHIVKDIKDEAKAPRLSSVLRNTGNYFILTLPYGSF